MFLVKTKEKLSRWFILLTAAIGCGIQMQSTFIAYFTYDTITRTTRVTSKYLELMTLSLCTPYADILDYKSLMRSKRLKLNKLSRDELHMAIQDLVTIREIFALTPDGNHIIQRCSLRAKSTRVRSDFKDATSCYEKFKVQKYYTQEFMCYALIANQFDIPYRTYHTTIDAPGEVYFVQLNRTFYDKLKFVKMIVHSSGLPYESKQFSAFTHLPKPNATLLKVQYERHFVNYLGYPYDKFTCTEEGGSYSGCLEKCANGKSLAIFNKVMHDLNIEFPYDYGHVSKKDVTDPNISKEVDDIIERCDQICNDRDCVFDYTLTHYGQTDFDSFSMVLTAPTAPDISIRFYPSIKFLDLFVYVMGAVGAWFGVAYINIDPIATIGWIKHKLKRDTQDQTKRRNQTHPFWWCYVNDVRQVDKTRMRYMTRK